MRTINLLTFFILVACSSTKTPDQKHSIDDYSIFGIYSYDAGGHGIDLNSDSTYAYYWGSCVASGYDSGKYTIKADTLLFKSLLQSNLDSISAKTATIMATKELSEHPLTLLPWQGHGQITPLTHEKYLIRGNKIYYQSTKGKYDMSLFWVKNDTTNKEIGITAPGS